MVVDYQDREAVWLNYLLILLLAPKLSIEVIDVPDEA